MKGMRQLFDYIILILTLVLFTHGYRPQNRSVFRHKEKRACSTTLSLFRNRKNGDTSSSVKLPPPESNRNRRRKEKEEKDESNQIEVIAEADSPKEKEILDKSSPSKNIGNYWINEEYGKNFTERSIIWNSHKQLTSVGESGLTETLINSVLNLAQSHNYIKVKISSHKLDSIQIAEQYFTHDCKASQELVKLVDIYEIRHRGILFRRVELLPEKVRPMREYTADKPRKSKKPKPVGTVKKSQVRKSEKINESSDYAADKPRKTSRSFSSRPRAAAVSRPGAPKRTKQRSEYGVESPAKSSRPYSSRPASSRSRGNTSGGPRGAGRTRSNSPDNRRRRSTTEF